MYCHLERKHSHGLASPLPTARLLGIPQPFGLWDEFIGGHGDILQRVFPFDRLSGVVHYLGQVWSSSKACYITVPAEFHVASATVECNDKDLQ